MIPMLVFMTRYGILPMNCEERCGEFMMGRFDIDVGTMEGGLQRAWAMQG